MYQLLNAHNLPEGWSAYPKTISGYRYNYSVKMALLSIFDKNHNEFWMIWSDLFPVMYFSWIFFNHIMYHEKSDRFHEFFLSELYLSVISSRVCSLIYHVFNCISIKMNKTLIYIDYIGIANMAFSTPWLYIITFDVESYEDTYFVLYLSCVMGAYTSCIALYLYLFMNQISTDTIHLICQYSLISLALIAAFPIYYAAIFHDMDDGHYYRMWSSIGLTTGYIIYSSGFPETFLYDGVADGKIWNSHVLWHICVSVAQYLYIRSY